MRYLIIIFLFLSLKGYGQTTTLGHFGVVTDSLGRISADKSFEKSIYIDTLRFLGHLSDEYLNDHGYFRSLAFNATEKIKIKADVDSPGFLSKEDFDLLMKMIHSGIISDVTHNTEPKKKKRKKK